VAEQRKLVAACDPDLRPLVMGALYTGARYGELSKVLVRDFDPIHRTLFIQWGKGKGDAVSRAVSLSPEAVAWFSEYTKRRQPEELMWRRQGVTRTKLAGLLKDPGAWIGYDQVFAMEKAAKAAGIAAVTFHELRHTCASGLINAGVPLMFVAKQLGHADTRMCERHYGHIARQALSASIEKLSPKLGLFEPAPTAGR
jgi:integrase